MIYLPVAFRDTLCRRDRWLSPSRAFQHPDRLNQWKGPWDFHLKTWKEGVKKNELQACLLRLSMPTRLHSLICGPFESSYLPKYSNIFFALLSSRTETWPSTSAVATDILGTNRTISTRGLRLDRTFWSSARRLDDLEWPQVHILLFNSFAHHAFAGAFII